MKDLKNIVAQRLLDETLEAAKTVSSDLRLICSSLGVEVEDLQFDVDGLNEAERVYRKLVEENRFTEDWSVEHFEDLLSLFVGEVLRKSKGAEWHPYTGDLHTVRPVLIRFRSGNCVDVSALCRDLKNKPSLRGAKTGSALAIFVKRAEQLAVIPSK